MSANKFSMNPIISENRRQLKRSILNKHFEFPSFTSKQTDTALNENRLLKPVNLLNSTTLKDAGLPATKKSCETGKESREWIQGVLMNIPGALQCIDEEQLESLTAETEEGEETHCSFRSEFVSGTLHSQDCKMSLIQLAASAMVEPGFLKKPDGINEILRLINDCVAFDPEFILKVSLYCRRDLNVRSFANLLLAIACHMQPCKKFVSKYFSAIVCLPSDWLEVANQFRFIFCSDRLRFPSVLRKNLSGKFSEFDLYQLAKYNKNTKKRKQTSKDKDKDHPKYPRLNLKFMIQLLHIHSPSISVMSILGKKYPDTSQKFFESGLDGEWNISLAGKRMKLPIPFTWETQLSAKGNNAKTWESLILSGKLPYMAMLRNLRNIIKAGVNKEAECRVVGKLTNPSSVISSKQFPFRFFAAYAAIDQLQLSLHYNGYLMRRSQRRATSTTCGTKKLKRLQAIDLKKVVPLRYGQMTLNRFRKAVDVAFAISIRNTIPPIRGSTLIICSVTTGRSNIRNYKNLKENLRCIGVLMGLMCASACESYAMYIIQKKPNLLAPIEEYVARQKNDGKIRILDYVQRICMNVRELSGVSAQELMQNYYVLRQHFDTVFLIGPMLSEVAHYVKNCRRHLGNVHAVWSDLTGKQNWPEDAGDPKAWTTVRGTSDVVLRYIAETSNKGLLDRVEKIDEIFGLENNIPVVLPAEDLITATQSVLSADKPLSEWRCCRVFVSSTFRDMHAERDLICGLLLPSVRQYAAHEFRVHVNEVDLRWGVPESATRTPSALRMCLEQATNADLFILLLGERYGWSPKSALVEALPQPLFRLVSKFYTPGMSMTEIEYLAAKHTILKRTRTQERRMGSGKNQGAITGRMFAFLRDPNSVSNIPNVHLLDFSEQHENKRLRLANFKSSVMNDGVVVHNRYPADYNGLISGYPVMGNLSEFAQSFTQCLRKALHGQYGTPLIPFLEDRPIALSHRTTFDTVLSTNIQPVACAISPRQLLELEKAFVELEARGKQCHTVRLMAAQKPLSSNRSDRIFASSSRKDSDGAVLLVTGVPGCGKTTHLAALSMVLSRPGWCPLPFRTSSFVADDRSGLLKATSVQKPTDILSGMSYQRPIIPHFTVLPHFVDGLALTGLPPNTRLMGLLEYWINRLLPVAECAAQHSYRVAKELECMKSTTGIASWTASSGDSNPLTVSRTTLLTGLIRLIGSLEGARFAFVLDSADHLQPAVVDWLPDTLPENVRFIISCDVNSEVADTLAARPDCLALTISGLTHAERAAAVRSLFGQYGKVLEESAFRNQLSLLVNKRNAEIPLYLRLACDELRLYGTYENLDFQLKALPHTIPSLVEHVIARCEAECGSRLTLTTLLFMCCSQRPLSVSELQYLLDIVVSDSAFDSDLASSWISLDGSVSPSDLGCSDSEQRISQLLSRHRSRAPNDNQKARLPPLAFHLLLSFLRPLLSGIGNDVDETDSEVESDVLSVNAFIPPSGLLRFRSDEIASHVSNTVFTKSNRPQSFSLVGYRPIRSTSTMKSKMMKHSVFEEDTVKAGVDKKHVHWMLATGLMSLEHKVYHFFHAGRLHLVCRLLTSPSFMISKFKSGYGSSILEDFIGYESGDPSIQQEWTDISNQDGIKSCLWSMRRFLSINQDMLMKYPFLFPELAINTDSDGWIRKLGYGCLAQLLSSKTLLHSVRLFVRHTLSSAEGSDSLVASPSSIYVPSTAESKGGAPTAIAISPNGKLLAYGTFGGTINIVTLSDFQELRSLSGHTSAIQSLYFIPIMNPGSSFFFGSTSLSSNFLLVSTSEDGSVSLWNVGTSLSSSGRLRLSDGSRIVSLNGFHTSSVTSCAWHYEHHILATGGLDGAVFLWTIPGILLEQGGVHYTSYTELPHKIIRTGSGKVSSVAFRLPSESNNELLADDNADTVAIGCWNGQIRIHDVHSLRHVKVLHVSDSAISSIEYSPQGGLVLGAQDITGRVFLWNSETYTLLCEVGQNSSDGSLAYRPGKICFSKPHGRYLITSGGSSNTNGQLKVWNACLGAYMSPWICSSSWHPAHRSLVHVTTFAVGPFGHVMVIGSNEGALALVCTTSNKIIHVVGGSSSKPVGCRVQAVACSLRDTTVSTNSYDLIVIAGFSSGFVNIYNCTILVENPGVVFEVHSGCQVTDMVKLLSFPVHADGSEEHHTARDGGTLSVSTDQLVAVSGGGNGVCSVQFLTYRDNEFTRIWTSHLSEFHSPVSAVSIKADLLAVGTKHRVIKIFSVNRKERSLSPLAEVHHATNDWITAISWFSSSNGRTSLDPHLIVGSNDHMVRVFTVDKESKCTLKQTVAGPGGSVTSLDVHNHYVAAGSTEGSVKMWKLSATGRLEFLSVVDAKSGWSEDQRTSSESVRVINVRLFDKSDGGYTTDAEGTRCDSSPDALSHSDTESEGENELSSNPNRYVHSVIPECMLDVTKVSGVSTIGRRDNLQSDLSDKATRLRLILGQEFPRFSPNEDSQTHGFRFRSVAPLLPECRTILRGHPGAVVRGLASGVADDYEADSLLMSVAVSVDKDSNNLTGDIRQWRLPTGDAVFCPSKSAHAGSVTCICPLQSPNATTRLCLSGGTDATLFCWRSVTDEAASDQCNRAGDIFAQESVDVAFRVCFAPISQPTVPVSAICGFTSCQAHIVFVAVGKVIWGLAIPEAAFAMLQRDAPLNVTELERMVEENPSSGLKIQSSSLPAAVIALGLIKSGDAFPGVLATLGDGSAVVISPVDALRDAKSSLPLKSDDSSFQDLLKAQWITSLHSLGTTVVGLCGTTPLSMSLSHDGAESPQIVSRRLLPESVLNENEDIRFIVPVENVLSNGMSVYLIVISSADGQTKLKVIDERGRLISESDEISNTRFSVTAICARRISAVDHPSPINRLMTVVATSDGLLHLMESKLVGGEPIRKIGLYPTGDHITDLHWLNSDPLQLITGSRSGSVHFYTIF